MVKSLTGLSGIARQSDAGSFSAMACPVKYILDMERSGFNRGAGNELLFTSDFSFIKIHSSLTTSFRKSKQPIGRLYFQPASLFFQ